MKRSPWTPFVVVFAFWLAAGLALDLIPVQNHWVRALVMGVGLFGIFLAAGHVRRARRQN